MFPPVEIMDTTLRDGEQTSGVSFNAREKLSIARLLLEELHVSRIEIASARVSQGEQQAVRAIAEWAAAKGYADRVEALGFIDGGVSLDWLGTAGCRVVNLLAKGSRKHCEGQLRRTPERHLEDVRAEILAAVDRGMKVNLYLEDWSNGMRRSPDYVYAMLDGLADAPVSRFMCPDTLGVLDPYDTERFCRDLVERYPSLHFDFHAHNDYDLAVANTAAAVRAGFHGVHVTVNGLGERAGNAPLSSAVAVLHDRLGRTTGIDETKINRVSRTVESYTGIRIPANRPIVGASVFTQCAGIHADGDSKNNLYFNELLPERFGRVREYALGKTSGKANIMKKTDGKFTAICHEVAADYPGITVDDYYIDIMTANLLKEPLREQFQVVLLPNLYGDIITDEAAQIQGGVGTAGSANIGDRFAMFEAIHGSAPRLMELGLGEFANPQSILKAEAMLLRHICRPYAAERLERALEDNPLKVTGDRDGATCREYTDMLVEML